MKSLIFSTQKKKLLNKKVLVTAGPTYEKIDPVRFIGNYSSGKMGFAIANELAEQGADVTLVTGPVSLDINHPRIQRINVESAAEMLEASQAHFPKMNAAVMCAAVADYRPAIQADQKIKRKENELSIELEATVDIAATLGGMKKGNQLLVGFALETQDEFKNASGKLQKKNLDFIVLNSLQDKGAGFGVDTNKITILSKDNKAQEFELKQKTEVAADIVKKIAEGLANL